MMGGQIAAGVGFKVGHQALMKRILSEANLKYFVPNGLEIW